MVARARRSGVFAGGSGTAGVRESGLGRQPGRGLIEALVLVVLTLISPACAELEVLRQGTGGGLGPPPSGSLSVGFIDVGQGDGVLVQAGGESYLIDAGRPEEGPNVVDFLRSRGVESLDGIVVTNPPISQNT
jgi:competence protein ComEC